MLHFQLCGTHIVNIFVCRPKLCMHIIFSLVLLWSALHEISIATDYRKWDKPTHIYSIFHCNCKYLPVLNLFLSISFYISISHDLIRCRHKNAMRIIMIQISFDFMRECNVVIFVNLLSCCALAHSNKIGFMIILIDSNMYRCVINQQHEHILNSLNV